MSTQNQKTLFRLISMFATDTLTAIVSQAYITVGVKTINTIIAKNMILQFAEKYFNDCAAWIYSREDPYINEKFDEMKQIPLENKNHPIDILHIIVMLTLTCLNRLSISNMITGAFIDDMALIKVHIFEIISQYQDIAIELRGCAPDHVHKIVELGDKIFTFTLNKV